MRIRITGGVISREIDEVIELEGSPDHRQLTKFADEVVADNLDYWSDYEILDEDDEEV